MKRTLILVFGTLFLFELMVLPSGTAKASGLAALCSADPASAPAGSQITVTCTGFVPGEITTAWFTEPDGGAFLPGNIGIPASKADSTGVVVYRFFTGFGSRRLSLGTWSLTIKGKNAIGIAEFRLTGGTEGVSGASLNVVDGELVGSGFAPNEIVTIWLDYPNGDCSEDLIQGPGASTRFGTDVKADGGGSFSTDLPIGPTFSHFDCAGMYHIVARGNSSHLGADTLFKTPNNPVTTNAILTASPSVAQAMDGLINFSGSGFAPLETVNCWLTTPQGAVPGASNQKADGAGNVAFSFSTGTRSPFFAASQGAVGDWFMTCRGNLSGRTAIAHFRLVGGIIDP